MSSEPADSPKVAASAQGATGRPSDTAAAEALERVAAGDRSAMLWLYDRFAPTLLAVALRITGAPADAEEIVQDAMVRAWIEAPGFDRARGSALAWLVALTRNRAIDVVRARGRRANHETESARSDLIDPPPAPDALFDGGERAEAVRAALTALTPDQRRTLDLAYFAGLSHAEIAEKLGQPLGTVKTRIAQAVRKLRAELSRFDQTT